MRCEDCMRLEVCGIAQFRGDGDCRYYRDKKETEDDQEKETDA